jgi:hypothetical protein
MIAVGGIYHHDAFYADAETGELRGKYLLILGLPQGNDVVYRLLTSRNATNRPPGCHHGDPYPGFALGVPGGELSKPSWVDLRAQDDYDIDVFRGRMGKTVIRHVMRLDAVLLRAAMACAAAADDTSNHQARCIRDAMAELAG